MNSGSDLCYDRYPLENGEEWLMRIGPVEAPPLLILPPLFEEMNRTRALIAALMRALAQRGFACWLPDLPGTGESERALDSVRWSDWTDAARSAAGHVVRASGQTPALAAIRGGSLLDQGLDVRCCWRFAPVDGASLARDLERASLVAPTEQAGEALDLAGYPVPAALLDALKAAVPHSAPLLRTVRLESDRGEADAKLAGPALWRRSEPGTSPQLAQALADDLAIWIERCAAS